MATIQEIDDFFDKLTDEFFKKQVPNIVAEKATEFFKERFTTKEWDGEPWPPQKIKRGELMVKSSSLHKSIKPSIVTPERVVISGGSEKIPYAKIHNEGGEIPITPKMRRFFWAMHRKEVGEDKNKDTNWKWLALTKNDAMKIPMRRFMGPSEKLNDVLFNALRDAFNAL